MKQPRETIHIPHFKMNNRSDRTNKKNKHIKFQTRCQRINHAQIDAMIATDQGAHKICMSDSRKIEREREKHNCSCVPGSHSSNRSVYWRIATQLTSTLTRFIRVSRLCRLIFSWMLLLLWINFDFVFSSSVWYIHNKFNRLCEWKIKATEKSILLSHLIHAITIKWKIFSNFWCFFWAF